MDSLNTDIVIVGGGIAGFAAALGLVEERRNVLIVEKNDKLGGNATMANVGTVCGAFYRNRNTADHQIPVGYNFSRSILSHVCELSGTAPLTEQDGLTIVPYEWSMLQRIIVQELTDRGVTLLTGTEYFGAERQGNRITRVIVVHQGKHILIEPKAVIDCSGNGIVSSSLGLEMLQEKSYQAASQLFRIQDVTGSGEYQLDMALKRAAARLTYEEHWTKSQLSLSVVPGSLRDGHVDLKLTLPDLITDDSLSNDQIRKLAAENIAAFFPLLKSSVSYLNQASLQSIFPQLGIRVMRRSKGKYVLTEEDVITSKKFEDVIAIGTWPIEEWGYDGKVSLQFSDSFDGYDIPAACLTSSGLENLYFAGKNISATARAIASARVMGTCLQTGYAAGKMASCSTEVERQTIIQQLAHELSETRI